MLALRSLRPPALARPAKRRCLSSLSPSSSTTSPASPSPADLDHPQPPYRVLFFGADTFSCEVFKRLHNARDGLLDQVTVVTPPDQRVGRKLREVHRPPLRLLAEEHGVPSISLPKTLLKGWQPPNPFLPPPTAPLPAPPSAQNLLLTASFGHLIPSSLLSLFRPLNCLNVHPSLLPKYRGAAPIQYGVLNGDADAGGAGMGVTVQELSKGKFDHGRILAQMGVDVPPDLDFLALEPILARAGGALLVSVLRDLAARQAAAYPQNPSLASLAPKLHKSSARVSWAEKTADEVLRLQRAVGHQYPLWTTYTPPSSSPSAAVPPAAAPQHLHLRLSPHLYHPLPTPLIYSPPGTLALVSDPDDLTGRAPKSVVVRCRDQSVGVEVVEVKKEGGRWVGAREWWNGVRPKGERSGEGVVLE
ncbi:hypothetical protein JCM8097_002436 [Rhodosporidiobolus ruineniae]